MHQTIRGRFNYLLNKLLILAVMLGMGIVSAPWLAFAQDAGPMAPPPKYETKIITTQPNSGPPPLPLPALIQQVSQHEDAIQQAYFTYTFYQEIRITEAPGADGHGGEFSVAGKVYWKPGGQRYLQVLKPRTSTLQRIYVKPGDVEAWAGLPMFVLTTAQLPNYNVTYEGDEKLDEIHTYILRIQPKELSRATKRFDGVVWVDDHDLAIVKSYGRFVSDVVTEATRENPFLEFEIYWENVAGHYWFPTYVRSDSVVTTKDDELHLRLVMRSSNFQLASAATTDAPATEPAGSGIPAPGAGAAASLPTPATNSGTPPAKP
jgi:outer membrane lipoprotein-sorting protein